MSPELLSRPAATSGLTPRIVGVSAAVALLIGVILASLTVAVVQLRDAGREAAEAEQKIGVVNRLERTVIDLETGQRGFLIDGDGRFLEPYTAARAALPDLLTWLGRVGDDPREQRLARSLVRGIARYEREWAVPIVDLGGRDLPAARRMLATGEGKAQVDVLRRLFDELVKQEQGEADEIRDEADAAGRRAVWLGVAGGIASVLLVLGFGAYLIRGVVWPVRRLARAVRRVAEGDLEAEVVETGRGEVGSLARGFNRMARSLQEHHDELEGQNAEVEAQRDDLERTFAELEDEKTWVDTLFRFVERLVAESGVSSVSESVLGQLTEFLRADAGAIWVLGEEGDLERQATVGVAPDRLPPVVDPASGVAGRALRERRPVRLTHADTGLEVEALGGSARVTHELHLPLLQRDGLIGVVSLGRVSDRPFGPDELDRARGMAEQATVAIAKAIEEARVVRLGVVNAAVLDATSFGVAMFDRKGDVILANRRLREYWGVLGMSFDDTVGDRVTRMIKLAVDREKATADLRRAEPDPSVRVSVELYEPDVQRWFWARTDPVFGEGGELLGRIVTIRETTAEHEIQRMRDEFVATVTHELRTPLSSVVAAVDLLEDETEDPTPGQQHWTGMIRRNVDRLLRLVDDLLTVARAESGQFTLHPEACDLATIAADAVASARAGAETKGVRVESEVAPAPIRADVTRIAQAVDNLLANAVKFTPAGGVVRVRVEPRRGTGIVVLEVADSGIGIPPEDRDHLFERFYRAPAATEGAIPGTGLGLTITKAIVDAHGGSIRVEDGIDGGTTFVVELPTDGPAGA
ncbi:ATP-binding protein [Patulibacter americanus]|uniref:ATP-binding protein n=1 Tax=Patulibacter americanus TaxID=588672 RepID=UPI0003B6DA6E|nr:ATP-binding protein [Patulibacter americanus]